MNQGSWAATGRSEKALEMLGNVYPSSAYLYPHLCGDVGQAHVPGRAAVGSEGAFQAALILLHMVLPLY